MSVSLTLDAVRARTKTVTRRHVDPSAPTCPSCGVVAAAETWPVGCGPSWYCYDCLRAKTVAASGDVAAARARRAVAT